MTSPTEFLAELAPHGVDLDALVQPMHGILIRRRRDGSWTVSLVGHCNPRLRKRTVFAEGADLADALRQLGAKLSINETIT